MSKHFSPRQTGKTGSDFPEGFPVVSSSECTGAFPAAPPTQEAADNCARLAGVPGEPGLPLEEGQKASKSPASRTGSGARRSPQK